VAAATVGLFGARARDVVRAAAAMPPGVPVLLAGSDLPTAAVGFCVREEWAGSLADLIERRLMLAFAPTLAAATPAAVAAELVRLGMLPVGRAEAEAAGCVRELRERYGKAVV
jgi:glycerol-3-phosphate dehydrogenase